MDPVTSFLVFVCLFAGAGIAYFVDPYLALSFLAVGALIAASMKRANVWKKFVVLHRSRRRRIRSRWCLHDCMRTAAALHELLHNLRDRAAGVSWLVACARLLILGSATRTRCAL